MQASNTPAKFPVPWASGAQTTGGPNGDGFRRTPPVASQQGVHDGYASFTDGFPPLTAAPVASGGVPPYVQDMNGALGLITAWDRWMQAGMPVTYDAAFASAMGGYPTGALLASTATQGLTWQSTADSNTSNPDGSNPTGWVAQPLVASVVTVLPIDGGANGGRLYLNGASNHAAVIVDNYNGSLRAYSGGTNGFIYTPASYALAIGSGTTGNVSAPGFKCAPNGAGDRVYYFTDSGYVASGYIRQDNTGGSTTQQGVTTGVGAIHICAGAPGVGQPEIVVDTSGGLTANALYLNGGALTNAGSIATTAAGGASFGTAGVTSAGSGAFTGEVDVYGSGIKFFGGAIGSGAPVTGQVIYNTTSTKMTGQPAETELWCNGGLFAVDSTGTGFLRGQLGTANAAVKIVTTNGSERRLKRDIEPLTGGLAALAAAPPIRFRYKDDVGYDPEPQRVGHFYEDLVEAMPEATLRVKDHGQVDQRFVVPYLHSAVLELEAKFEAKIAAMQARLDAMERRLPAAG